MHPCPNHNSVRVSRAYGHQCIHAQTIIPFVFRERTVTPDDGLTGPQRRTLLRLSAAKQPTALRDASDWLIVAGDNGAESEFSRSKQQMRRQSLLGHSAPATVHMDALASVRLLAHPGLLPLMQAFRLHREARRHELAHSPSEFLDPVKDRSWLFR